MAKGKNKNRYKAKLWQNGGSSNSHFLALYDAQSTSPAYKALSSKARDLYTILRIEYKNEYTDSRVGVDTVICPYSTIIQYNGLGKRSVSECIDELEQYGFIKCERGGFQNPNKYIFIDTWATLTDRDIPHIKQEIKIKKHQHRAAKKAAKTESENVQADSPILSTE